jgi:hypothetical protein
LLWGWNAPATCSPMGAKNWRADLYAATLRGADIVVMPDNDPDGRLYLDAAAASLIEVGAAVRVLNLPGLGPKGDVINWAAGGGTVKELLDLIEHARPWQATASSGEDRAEGEPRKARGDGKTKARWYGENAAALDAFARRLCLSLLNPMGAWPDRPKLPIREQKKSPQLHHQGSPHADK